LRNSRGRAAFKKFLRIWLKAVPILSPINPCLLIKAKRI
jgi:hypothetical protein